jgi:hypothetical protein
MGKRLGPRALGAFVCALERGEKVVEAAEKAGFKPSSFYRRRHADGGFAAAWDEAVSKSAGVMLIAAANGRGLQKRRTRRVKFTRERKEQFLAHFAATCDQTASAEAAGVSRSTVDKHLASDAPFAEAWQRALEAGYRLLEAELVGRQRAAQERYRVEPDAEAAAQAKDFDRSVQLLTLWQRKDGRIGRRDPNRGDVRQRWTFDEAIDALAKKLRAFGVRAEEEGSVELERVESPVLLGSQLPSPRPGQIRAEGPLHQPSTAGGRRKLEQPSLPQEDLEHRG